MYTRDKLLGDLRDHVIEVHFTKVDGTPRAMRCTLMPNHLPPSYTQNVEEQAGEKEFHSKNPDVLAVWDVQKGGWRSFRIDSVTYCQVIDGY